jgi:transposase
LSRLLRFSDAEIAHARQQLANNPLSHEALSALSVLLSTALSLTTSTIASILGVSRPTITRHIAAARAASEGSSEPRNHGGRRRQTMSLEEEKKFLEPWLVSAKEGGVLTVGPIHNALKAKIGRNIALSTTYRMLARHGWRKVAPDTRHPKSNPQAQEDFKKI